MTSDQEIQQFECRWQQSADLSPIAASESLEAARSWFQRMNLWIRPARPGQGVPDRSVRYAVFDDGQAALAWRHWNVAAVTIDDQTERRPMVARVLVGDVRLLTPEVAVAVCRTGLPSAIGPAPGQVTRETRLPAISARALSELPRETMHALDEAACSARGMDLLIAAALSDHDTPLSVQLPDRAMALPPRTGEQGPLLWGLLQIVGTLLADPDSQLPGERGWSFSTYEPPLGDKDVRGLADTVFRTQHVKENAQSTRQEIVVRPHDLSERAAPPFFDELAKELIRRFTESSNDLFLTLFRLTKDVLTADQKIQAVAEELLPKPKAASRAAARDGQPTQPGSATDTNEERAKDYRDALAEDSTRGDSLTEGPGAADQSADPAQQANPPAPATATRQAAPPETTHELQYDQSHLYSDQESLITSQLQADLQQAADGHQPAPQSTGRPGSETARQVAYQGGSHEAANRATSQSSPRASASQTGSGGRPPETIRPRSDPARPQSGVHQRKQDGSPPPLPVLLDRLYTGRNDPEFERIRDYLATQLHTASPTERAAVRERMAERGWYIQVLSDPDSWQVERVLERIFTVTVMPDLNLPEVAREVTRWVGEYRAPDRVIKALNAAAQHQGEMPGEQMARVLGPVLGYRYLRELDTSFKPPRNPRGPNTGVPVTTRSPNAAETSQLRRASWLKRVAKDNITFGLLLLCILLAVALIIKIA